MQDEITERRVAGLETSVQAAEIKRARLKPTESLIAYDLYLRALPDYFGATRPQDLGAPVRIVNWPNPLLVRIRRRRWRQATGHGSQLICKNGVLRWRTS